MSVSPAPSLQHCIEVFRYGQHLQISQQRLEAIDADFCIPVSRTTNDGQHGYVHRHCRQSLVLDANGERIANLGCLEAISYQANDHNAKLRVTNGSTAICRLPTPELTEQLQYPDLARFVHDCPNGLIKAPSSVKRGRMVAELAVAFRRQRIVVVGTKLKMLQAVATELRKLLPAADVARRRIEVVSDRNRLQIEGDDPMPWICCATPTSTADLDLAQCDLVIILDAASCTHQTIQHMLQEQDARFRLFGILDPNRGLRPSELGKIRATFGFDEIQLLWRRKRRNVQLAMVRHAGPNQNVAAHGQNFDYRRDVMFNGHRNDTIRRIASAISTGRETTAACAAEIRQWREDQQRNHGMVYIVTAGRDHATELHRRLNGSWLHLEPPSDPQDQGQQPRSATTQPVRSPSLIHIFPASVTKDMPGYDADVVIWAGAGVSTDAVPASWMFAHSDACRPLLIVDFLDHFLAKTRGWGTKRRADYARRDIYRVGENPKEQRIKQFIRDFGGRAR